MTMSQQTRFWPKHAGALLLCFVIFTALGVSICTTILSISEASSTRTAESALQCPPINGNQDMYGLGIRLGIYLQLIVTAVVDTRGYENTSLALAPPTLWFLFAMYFALLKIMRDPTTYAVESYIVISLGNGITWILVGGSIRLDPLTLRETYLASFARFILWGVWRTTSSVYWWTLSGANYHAVPDGCGPWGWLLFQVELSNRFITVHKFFNALSWLGLLQSILPYIFGTILTVSLLVRMDISEMLQARGISKGLILFDYMFVPIGHLRGIVFGTPKSNPIRIPEVEMDAVSADNPHTDVEMAMGQAGGCNPPGKLRKGLREVENRLKNDIYNRYQLRAPSDQGICQLAAQTSQVSTSIPSTADPEISITDSNQQIKRRDTEFNAIYQVRDTIVGFLRDHNLEGFPFLAFWDGCGIIITILTVEFTLKLNGIYDVYDINSVGQLVAFVVGLGGVLMALSSFYAEKRSDILQKGIDARERTARALAPGGVITRLPQSPTDSEDSSNLQRSNYLGDVDSGTLRRRRSVAPSLSLMQFAGQDLSISIDGQSSDRMPVDPQEQR